MAVIPMAATRQPGLPQPTDDGLARLQQLAVELKNQQD
jgi:hypothetical protein